MGIKAKRLVEFGICEGVVAHLSSISPKTSERLLQLSVEDHKRNDYYVDKTPVPKNMGSKSVLHDYYLKYFRLAKVAKPDVLAKYSMLLNNQSIIGNVILASVLKLLHEQSGEVYLFINDLSDSVKLEIRTTVISRSRVKYRYVVDKTLRDCRNLRIAGVVKMVASFEIVLGASDNYVSVENVKVSINPNKIQNIYDYDLLLEKVRRNNAFAAIWKGLKSYTNIKQAEYENRCGGLVARCNYESEGRQGEITKSVNKIMPHIRKYCPTYEMQIENVLRCIAPKDSICVGLSTLGGHICKKESSYLPDYLKMVIYILLRKTRTPSDKIDDYYIWLRQTVMKHSGDFDGMRFKLYEAFLPSDAVYVAAYSGKYGNTNEAEYIFNNGCYIPRMKRWGSKVCRLKGTVNIFARERLKSDAYGFEARRWGTLFLGRFRSFVERCLK